jgi:hypothetical protein
MPLITSLREQSEMNKTNKSNYRSMLKALVEAMNKAKASGQPMVVPQGYKTGGPINTSGWNTVGHTTQAGIHLGGGTAGFGNHIHTVMTNTGNMTINIPSPVAENLPLCRARKGGPRSKIYCEIFAKVPHEVHLGRGKTWHQWKDRDA